MSARARPGLVERIRQLRRVDGPAATGTRSAGDGPDEHTLRALEDRVLHLEQLVQGLQDAVYRESRRQAERIAELEARMQPASIAKALSADARKRGL